MLRTPTKKIAHASVIAKRVRDPLFLFLYHLEWRDRGNLKSYQELMAALDDADQDVRALAEHLLRRASPRPRAHQSPDARWEDFR